MQLKSLSASAVKAWEACPAMAGASSINKVPQGPAVAADLGSACHAALEFYVKAAHMEHSISPDLNILLKLFDEAYAGYFGADKHRHREGVDMMRRWHERTDFSDREVLSVEVKKNFTLKTSIGDVTFNYIFDRVDRFFGRNELEVVDYKSWMIPVTAEGMEDDAQMRTYALAADIEWKGADRIWVSLDQLRYDLVGTVFTREQNINTWRFLQKVAEDIIYADGENLPETLNRMCRFCIRRHKCETLNKHAAVGGPLALSDPMEATRTLANIEAQIAGLQSIQDDLQAFLLDYAFESGNDTWDAGDTIATISASRRRDVDPQRIASIIGPEKFASMGKITMASVDELLKDPETTAEQKRQINSMITWKSGNPKVKTKRKGRLNGKS